VTHSTLTTRLALTSDTEYGPRLGTPVDSIGHHHAAGTSLEGLLLNTKPGGRQLSFNYGIKDHNIVLVVPEEFRAFTSGSGVDDRRSITYEICNDSVAPEWRISDASYESVIALDRDIRSRYPLIPAEHGMPGLWEHRNLYEWFGRSYITACAGPGFHIDRVIAGILAGPDEGMEDEMNGYYAKGDKADAVYFVNRLTGLRRPVTDGELRAAQQTDAATGRRFGLGFVAVMPQPVFDAIPKEPVPPFIGDGPA